MENQEPEFVECPECGAQQADMGRGVACEECGYAPMPSLSPKEEVPETPNGVLDLRSDLPLQWTDDDEEDSSYATFGEYVDSVRVDLLPDQPGKYSVDVDPPYVSDRETGKRLAEAIAEAICTFFDKEKPS